MSFLYLFFLFFFYLSTMDCLLQVVPIKSIDLIKKLMALFKHSCEDYILKSLIDSDSVFTIIVNKKLDENMAFTYAGNRGYMSVLKTYGAMLNGRRHIYYTGDLDNFCIEDLYNSFFDQKSEEELNTLINNLSL